MNIISVPIKKYRKLCYQNSEEGKITWAMIVKKMGLGPHFGVNLHKQEREIIRMRVIQEIIENKD